MVCKYNVVQRKVKLEHRYCLKTSQHLHLYFIFLLVKAFFLKHCSYLVWYKLLVFYFYPWIVQSLKFISLFLTFLTERLFTEILIAFSFTVVYFNLLDNH